MERRLLATDEGPVGVREGILLRETCCSSKGRSWSVIGVMGCTFTVSNSVNRGSLLPNCLASFHLCCRLRVIPLREDRSALKVK
jgi:hypothetical protein